MPGRPRRRARPVTTRPQLRVGSGRHAVHPLILGVVGVAIIAPVFGSCGAASSAPAAAPPKAGLDIPNDYYVLYQVSAKTCPGLDWSVLAGIGKIETNHGRSALPGVHSGQNYAGAEGPMQFLAATFASVRQRHPQLGPNVYDPTTAIPAAAFYLCDNGYTANPRGAIWQYNHADWYVNEVLDQAHTYKTTTT